MVSEKNSSRNLKYELIPSHIFLKQLELLSNKTKRILAQKLLLLEENPSRNKRIKGYDLFLFRIRIKDRSEELRVLYLLDKQEIKLICILQRKNDYADLAKYLKKLGF